MNAPSSHVGFALALAAIAAPPAFSESGVTHRPIDPADFAPAPVAPKPLEKSVADLFCDFDAAYAAAPDLPGRGRAAKLYLTALQQGKAPEERAQVIACVKRFREADGPAGLYRLYLSVPNAHIPIVMGETDAFEKKMMKALAENHVRDAATQQRASLAEPSRPFALPAAPTAPAKPAHTAKPAAPAPPPYDLNALRRRAFAGDGLAALDLALHYSGIRDRADDSIPACKYWVWVAQQTGRAAEVAALRDAASKNDDTPLRTLMGALKKEGSRFAAAIDGPDDQPDNVVSRTKTITYTFKDGTQVAARHKTLGDAYASDAVTPTRDLSHIAVESAPDRDRPAVLAIDGVPQRQAAGGLVFPEVFFAPAGDRVAYVAHRFRTDTPAAPIDRGDLLVLDGKLVAETDAGSGTHFRSVGFSPDGRRFLFVESGKHERLMLDFKYVGGGDKIARPVAWYGGRPVYAARTPEGWKLFDDADFLRALPGEPSDILISQGRIMVATYATETGGAYVFVDDKSYGPFGAVDLPGFSKIKGRPYWYASPADDKRREKPQQLWIDGVATAAVLAPLDRRPPAFDGDETHWIAHGPNHPERGYTLVRDGKEIHASKYASPTAPALTFDGDHWGCVSASGRNANIVVDGIVAATSRSPALTADALMEKRFTSPRLFWRPDSTPAWIVGDGRGWSYVADDNPLGPFDLIDTHTLLFHAGRAIFEAEAGDKNLLCVEGGKILTLPGEVRTMAIAGKTLRVLLDASKDGKRPKRGRAAGADREPVSVALMTFDLDELLRPVGTR